MSSLKSTSVLLLTLLLFAGKKTVVAQTKNAVSHADSMAIWEQFNRADDLYQSDVDSAIAIYEAQKQKAKALHYLPAICKANNGIANCYFVKGEYGIAFEILSDNVKYFNTLSPVEEIATYRLLMYACAYTLKFDLGIQYGRKALMLIDQLKKSEPVEKHNVRLVSIAAGMINIYGELNELDSARYYLNIYKTLLNPADDRYPLRHAQQYELEGYLYGKAGDTKNGAQYFEKAIALYRKADANSRMPQHVHTMIFDMYVNNRQFSEAKKMLPELLRSDDMESLELRQTLYPKMASIDSAEGNFKEAYALLSKTLELTDSIQSQEILTRSAYYGNKIGLYEANEQVLQQANTVRNTRYLIIIITLFSLTLIGLLLVYFYNRRLRMQLRHHQELKQIGNDLHDEINPILGYARMMLSRVEAEDSNDRQLLQKSGKALEETMDNLRQLTRQMNMLHPDKHMYTETLKEMIHKLCSAYGYTDNVALSFYEKQLSESQKRNLFLVLQELVHNSMKYAEGDEVFVAIKTVNTQLQVTYADNGIGLPAGSDAPEAVLPKIHRRISQMQGKTAFAELPGYHGLCISFKIPIEK